MSEENKVVIPIGPQHPALDEPASFTVTLNGEKVDSVVIGVGYNHRGLEKACESRSYIRDLYIIERVCGICSHAHTSAFCMAVERLAGVTVPERAEYIRAIVAELERLHSHLLWLGVAGHEIGFDTLFMYSWRDREKVVELLADIGGNRINYAVNTFGGVRRDINGDLSLKINKVMDELDVQLDYYIKLATTEPTLKLRLSGVGKLSKEDALKFGATGPVLRAAGVAEDIRVSEPYGVYNSHKVNVITADSADVFGRTVVRLLEMKESIRLIRTFLDNIPEGDLLVKVPRRIPEGEVIVRVEAPRGEDIHYVRSNGTDIPDRVRVRAPTEANWHGMQHMLKNEYLADVPVSIAAIDPCYSCTDRAITLKSSKKTEVTDWNSIREYGIEFYKKRGMDFTSLHLERGDE